MNKLYTIFKKLEGAYADTTIRAYEKNMKTYVEFCDANKYSVLPLQSQASSTLLIT